MAKVRRIRKRIRYLNHRMGLHEARLFRRTARANMLRRAPALAKSSLAGLKESSIASDG